VPAPDGGSSRASPNPTDLRLLRTEAYATPAKLDDRRALYEFQDPRPDFFGWILDQVGWPARGRVLDLGCGPGSHLSRLGQRHPDLELYAADLSEGMLVAARTVAPRSHPLALDACSLPFAGDVFTTVMANHMLYHVADLDRAVAEIRRTLEPGGTLIAVTNSVEHLAELYSDVARAAGIDHWNRPTDHFTLEDHGVDLRRRFDHVEVRHHRGELVVPAVEPLLTYTRSMRPLAGGRFTDAEWEQLMVDVDVRFAAGIARHGCYRIGTHAGAFVCR
jgi:SAM-dependent methyltransferase